MAKLSCDVLQYLPLKSDVQELSSSYIANCVFNSFLSYSAIMLNIVTIHAIRKTRSLPKPLRTLLLSLAISDVGVGLLGQPLYISLLVNWLQNNIPNCITYNAFFLVVGLISFASFFGVMAISLDRFLAIHLHLRYQELVTHKCVVAVVISIWLLSAFLSIITFWLPTKIYFIIISTIIVVCILITTIVYCRIYLVVRRHKNQMQALQMQEIQQVAQNSDMAHFASLRKSAVGVFFVYLVFLVCYMPSRLLLVAKIIQGPSIANKRFTLYSWTLVFLNSTLNPVVYCWKMRHIRQTVMDILRNIVRRYGNCQAH